MVSIRLLAPFLLFLSAYLPYYYSSFHPTYIGIRILTTCITQVYKYIPYRIDDRNISTEYRAFETLVKYTSKPIDLRSDPLKLLLHTRNNYPFNDMLPQPIGCIRKEFNYTYNGHTVKTYWITYPDTPDWHGSTFMVYHHGGVS